MSYYDFSRNVCIPVLDKDKRQVDLQTRGVAVNGEMITAC